MELEEWDGKVDMNSENYVLQNLSYIATLVIAVFALVGTVWAIRDTARIKRKERKATIKDIMQIITHPESRVHRRIIFNYLGKAIKDGVRNGELAVYVEQTVDKGKEIESRGTTGDQDPLVRIKNAIEEVVICYDEVGFMLIKGDSRLRKELPDWVYGNLGEMWKYIGSYIERRMKEDKEWAKYYKEIYYVMPEQYRATEGNEKKEEGNKNQD